MRKIISMTIIILVCLSSLLNGARAATSDGLTTSSCEAGYPEGFFRVCFYQGTDPETGAFLGSQDETSLSTPVPNRGFGINHDWGQGPVFAGIAPGLGGTQNDISGVWRARLSFTGGRYQFTAFASDGVRLFIDEQLIINEWNMTKIWWRFGAVTELTAGFHNLRVEWFATGLTPDTTLLRLHWDQVPTTPDEKVSRLVIDVFLLEQQDTCIVGDPWVSGEQVVIYNPDLSIYRAWQRDDANGLPRTLPPSDSTLSKYSQVECFSFGYRPEQIPTVKAEVDKFAALITNWSAGRILPQIRLFEIQGEVNLGRVGSAWWVPPWEIASLTTPLMTRESDFAIVLSSAYDLDSGRFYQIFSCGAAFGLELYHHTFGGTGYSWVPCVDGLIILHEWEHQFTSAMRNLLQFETLYPDYVKFPGSGYPACGTGDADIFKWFPDSEDWGTDPESPWCGLTEVVGIGELHLFAHFDASLAHYPLGFVTGNHCDNGIEDFGESPVDAGSNCPPDVDQSPPPGIDLDVTYISREPRYHWDAIKKWPDIGEKVTFTAHVINKGTINSSPFTFQWIIDDQIVSAGSNNSLPPQGETTQVFEWTWESGRHYIGFQVDPQNLISETSKTNNIITDPTDALIIGFWVEQSVYDEFNHIQNGEGTYSWEDWAQRIIQKMNLMFEQSVYPSAPQGVLTRVRLDNITIVPDGSLFELNEHAPYDPNYDGRWGFSYEEYHNCQCCPTAVCYDVPWWVIHELGHYLLGRVDLYALNVQGGDVNVLDESGNRIAGTPLLPYIAWDVVHYVSRVFDIMHTPDPYSLFSDYHTYSLNRDWPQGQRTHMGWDYIYQIPSETKIRVLDNNDQPLANVQVSVYQALPGDGSSGPYSQNFDNIPDIVGTTDSQGLFSLGSKPFGQFESYGITVGIALVKLKNLDNGKYEYIWIESTDLNLAYWKDQTGVYIHDVHFPNGPKTLRLSENNVRFLVPEGTNPTPQNVMVEMLGEGVQYWSVQSSSVPWLYTIPSPNIALSYSNYPPGPLTCVIKSANLPPGIYSTTLMIDAGVDIINSPQLITITLEIYEVKKIFIPTIVNWSI